MGKSPISDTGIDQFDIQDSDSLIAGNNDSLRAIDRLSESVISPHLILQSSTVKEGNFVIDV